MTGYLKNSKKITWTAGFCYLVIFLLFFLQYPLQNSLTGDLDTIANLAMYKQVRSAIAGLIGGYEPGSTNFPSEHVWMAWGADFGLGFVHLFFNFLGLNDVWANWLFIVFIFTANSVVLFLLARLYLQSVAAFLAGIFFSLCQFTIGNLENPNTLFFALCFLSLYFFKRHVANQRRSFFIVSLVLGAAQVYLVPYVFLLHAIMLGILVLTSDFQLRNWKNFLLKYIPAAVLYFLIVFPYFYFYVLDSPISGYYNPIKALGFTHVYSLNINDFVRVLPNHLLFDFNDQIHFLLIFKMKAAFVGISFWLSSVAGLWVVRGKARRELAAIWLAGFIFCLGPYISFDLQKVVPNITWPLYEYLDFGSILRIPARAFFLCIFSMSILTGYFIRFLWGQGKYGKPVIVLIVLLFIIENIPFPMQVYKQDKLLHPDAAMVKVLNETAPGKSTVLHLPSALFGYDGDKREYTYMYWQSLHGQNILNGALGFFPPVRMANDSLMRAWFEDDNLEKLVNKNGVDILLFHKDLAADDPRLTGRPERLAEYPFLKKRAETGRTIIMEVNRGNE